MARSFNGTTDKIIAPLSDAATTTQYHLSFWTYFASLPGGNAGFLFVGDRGATNGFYFYITSTGVLHFVSTAISDFTTSATLSANTWYNILYTSDSVPHSTIYVNGVSAGTPNLTHNTPSPNQININPDFACRIAQVTLWHGGTNQINSNTASVISNGALTRDVTLNIAPSLRVWLPLDGLQSPEPDFSGFANNGTLTGTALAAGPPVMMFTPRWPQGVSSTSTTTYGSSVFDIEW